MKSDSKSVLWFLVPAVTRQKEGKNLGAIHQRHITEESEAGHPPTEISNSWRNIVALMAIVTDKTRDTDTVRCPKEENIDVGVFCFFRRTFVCLYRLSISLVDSFTLIFL
jgi:hypothetical protein